ncbi:MAG: TIGR04282 family arsenosugar biosynthesis glycosyltransferase [Gemmatimonadota bacterium]|nr:TIGR04282 family arsenosugar biosynthesis glycosyltransferase [Gemmatimonadota bacterium]
MSNALVLFMKAPRPGTVKTRLTPSITMDEAAELYRAFILDTLHLAQRTDGVSLFVAWTPDDGRAELLNALGCPGDHDVNWLRQRGSHLGERLSNAFSAFRQGGWEKTVVLGGDSPLLPRDYIEEAFEALDRHDVVLGPADDGGYYLIGLGGPGGPGGPGDPGGPDGPNGPGSPDKPRRRGYPADRYDRLFESIHWGTGRVLRQTRAAIRACGFSSHELPSWHDVDRPADLDRLAREIRALRAGGDHLTGRCTEAALTAVIREGRDQ